MRPSISSCGKKIASVAAACAGFFLYSFPVSAQVDLGLNFATAIGLGTTDIRTTIARIISYFLGLLGIIAVCIMLYAGFLWMTAGGNEEKVTTAKKWMINGVIGLIIIMSAFAITQFILRAVVEGTLGTSGGCLPGQVCGGPGGFGGGTAGAFTVTGVSPAGPGPSNGGWPKNYGITIGFSAEVSPVSVTASTVVVKKCNARVNGSGEAQPFNLGSCSGGVSGTRSTENGRVVFKPNATPGDEPTDFEGDFWYYVQIFGGQVKDTRGRSLVCPLVSGDISAAGASGNLCDRAVAVNNQRDVAPPTVEVNVPRSRPDYCEATIPVQAVGEDDFLVSRIDLTLDDGSPAKQALLTSSSEVNGGMLNPFSVDWVTIDATGLSVGDHVLSAKAYDGVPQSSSPAESRFTVPPINCCNNVQDGNATTAPFETGIDCGAQSGCGSCAGDECTTSSQCASGTCVDGRCVELPIIENVTPTSAGPGTLVTVRGKFFGASAGSVVFMGTADPGDDKVAVACATGAWKELTDAQGNPTGVFEVVVAVPEGAVDGPVKLTAAGGSSDTTEPETPPEYELVFDVTTTTLPGICSLAPSTGSAGSDFTINGTGFGDTSSGSRVTMGSNDVSLQTGGWTATAVTGIVPSIREGSYAVKVRVGSLESNTISYAVRPPAGQEKPQITEINPDNAPPGAYITILGRGFGSSGTVRFFFGTDNTATVPDEREIAIGDVPACSDYWHNNYVVIKVPDHYECNSDPRTCAIKKEASPGALHKVQITTSNASLPPTNLVDFRVRDGVAGPGICSISPPSGPAGMDVVLSGEGFGAVPDSDLATMVGPIPPPNPPPLKVVRFFKSTTDDLPSEAYGAWNPQSITAYVPGITTDKATWPKTGPVTVVADNAESSNSVPFIVADCNDAGGDAFCKQQSNTLVCCASGACDTACGPLSRNSAFGWRFSTDVLPALPVVIERASCSLTTLQSPSPFKGSQDSCINTAIQVEFNTAMKADSLLVEPNILIDSCGDGEAANCAASQTVAFGTPTLTNGRVLLLYPFGLEQKTWYRVTLNSTPIGGIRDTSGRSLDGDYDEVPGGDYVFMFRVRDNSEACAIDNVLVVPPTYTVDHQGPPLSAPGAPDGFMSNLVAANCNPLVCRSCPNPPSCSSGVDQYNVAWPTPLGVSFARDAGAVVLGQQPTLVPQGFCSQQWQPVTAVRETLSSVKLTAEVRKGNEPLTKEGTSQISVKFADPVVTEYGPNCDEACVNAKIYAMFSVPMNGSGNDLTESTNTFTDSTVRLIKCRNASCNAPFDTDDQPATPGIEMITERIGTGTEARDLVKGIEIVAELEPQSFYLVKLKGGTGGIESSSGVTLKGLTDGDWFTWKFRTKDNGTPCVPARAVIEPSEAVLQYVPERLPFRVTPFGSPDECDAEGQPLNADSYDWQWSKTDEVIAGFLPDETQSDSRVNTEPGMTAGCSASCLASGSQNIEPQCGNGLLEDGEDCENDPAFSSHCNPANCLWRGDSQNCGDGDIDEGEQCDCRLVGTVCEPVPGCQSCLWTGASQGRSVCGDGYAGDGESCDDGNGANGDGCSNQCLKEGTLPSCLDVAAGKPCVNFCGNGREETGEDPGCDIGPGNVAVGCDEATCLKKGTNACAGPASTNCCGNGGNLEPGEECEAPNPGDALPQGCTNRCLNAGSAYSYDTPSFCRDGSDVAASVGEENKCEIAPASVGPEIDPFQVIVGSAPTGTSAGSFTSTITATLDEIPTNGKGSATVTLSRPCTPENPGICAAIASGLGCTADGYCAEAPEVLATYPLRDANNVCRNTVVRVSFDQPMDGPSIQKNMIVGELMPSNVSSCGKGCSNDLSKTCTTATVATDCGQGNECVDRRSVGLLGGRSAADRPAGFFARIWDAVVRFVKDFLALAVSAATAPELPPTPPRLYCEVTGSITVVDSEATWSPKKSLKASLWYRVFLKGETPDSIKAVNGVNKQEDESFHFKTAADICVIDTVAIAPESHLFTTSEDLGPVCSNNGRACTPETSLQVCGAANLCTVNAAGDLNDGDHRFRARAHPAGRPPDAEIVTTEEYSFKWRWSLQGTNSVIEVTPDTVPLSATNGWCETGEYASSPAHPPDNDCKVKVDLGTTPDVVPGCGNEICELTENAATCAVDCNVTPGHGAVATVKVRTGTGFPKNGDAVVDVTADISERRVRKTHISASSDVVVMLCKKPWPARKTCPSNGWISLPWDTSGLVNCTPNTTVWYPFYDKERDTTFYYCRDGQSAGAEQDDLPELKERVVSVQPGRDVLKEYLFTFATPGPWQRDAIGFRITTNPRHLGIRDWYDSQGFRGAPTSETIDGYDALREGRTVYVNSAARVSDKLFTNINVLSVSDAAQPETTAIFNRFLGNIDMNRNVKDLSYCIDATGNQVKVGVCSNDASKQCTRDNECRSGSDTTSTCTIDQQTSLPISCNTDRECRVDKDGKLIPQRGMACSHNGQACTQNSECGGSWVQVGGGSSDPRCATCTNQAWICPRNVGTNWNCLGARTYAPYGGTCQNWTWESFQCGTAPQQVWVGNTCNPAGYTCLATKTKLVRDVKRWADLQSMRDDLLIKRNSLPTVEAGSFLRARTNSAWPSWNDALASVIGSVPRDPVNSHMECPAGYDPATCWNATSKLYMCPKDSHVYGYQSIGGVDFTLSVDLEARCGQYTSSTACTKDPKGFCRWTGSSCVATAIWSGGTCIEKKDLNGNGVLDECCAGGICDKECEVVSGACVFKDGNLEIGGVNDLTGICKGTAAGAAGSCGDGIVQSPEACEPGLAPRVVNCSVRTCRFDASITCATDSNCPTGKGPCGNRNGTQLQTCNTDCTWGATDACRGGVCGDGVVQQPDETCDDGSLNGTYGKCNTGCTGYSASCGDGQKQINEACDCGAANGAYKFNGRLQPEGQACTSPTIPTNVNSCGWDCSGAGPYCGDEIINGSEECDGGFQEFKGYCNDDLKTGCDSNTQCNFGACQGGKCVGNASVSCSADSDCQKTCGNYCPTVEQRNRRLCNTNKVAIGNNPDTSDDPSNPLVAQPTKACRWSNWFCTAPGACGNGKKETGEECDDGNTDNTDGCIIDPVNNYNCKLARCADTYISTTNLEQCDLGTGNGQTCQPEYDRECNYCTSACKTGTVSGGFCGNGLVEDPSYKPPGPEECDGTTGMDNWVCVGTKVGEQSYGRYVPLALDSKPSARCADSNCKRICAAPDTKLCYNDPNSSNVDRDDQPNVRPARNYEQVGPSGTTTTFALRDVCDPDKDDDGVPAAFGDCDDSRASVHPAYNIPGGAAIPIAPEVCDGLDNDCDTAIDENLMGFAGRVMDGSSPVNAILVSAYCNGSALLGSVRTGADGRYSLVVDIVSCKGGANKIRLKTGGTAGAQCYGDFWSSDYTPAEVCSPATALDFTVGKLMTINGNVKNARTGAGDPGVTVSVLCTNPASATPLQTTTTDGSGNYSARVAVPQSCVSVAVAASADPTTKCSTQPQPVAYSPTCAPNGQTVNNQNIIIAPKPAAGNYLVFLTWTSGRAATAHMRATYNGTSCSQDHTTSAGCSTSGNLCLDTTATNGPQTYTIKIVNPARYRYYITFSDPQPIRNNGAQVQVWRPDCSSRIYNITDATCRRGFGSSPTSCTGSWWEVFRIENRSGTPTITDTQLLGDADPNYTSPNTHCSACTYWSSASGACPDGSYAND